jgi:FtsH-binding integral membrane protein
MPGCPYFIANTFAHLLGGLFVTGISTENPLITDMENKPMTHLAILLALFVNVYAVLAVEPGPIKYALFASMGVIIGQALNGFANRLKQKGLLTEVLISTAMIFFTMTAIGIFDDQNLLSWGIYLWGALSVLLIATLFTVVMAKDEKERSDWKIWLGRLTVVLFTIYIAFDVEILKENAAACNGNPDYVNESVNLYLDIVNLFTGLSNAAD